MAIVKLAGMIVFLFGVFGNEQWALMCVGCAAIFACALYDIALFRCPICSHSISEQANSMFTVFALPAKFKACPLCGTDLDEQIPGSDDAN